jgi:hypothetical protein
MTFAQLQVLVAINSDVSDDTKVMVEEPSGLLVPLSDAHFVTRQNDERVLVLSTKGKP